MSASRSGRRGEEPDTDCGCKKNLEDNGQRRTIDKLIDRFDGECASMMIKAGIGTSMVPPPSLGFWKP
jgi:hypothetical protein